MKQEKLEGLGGGKVGFEHNSKVLELKHDDGGYVELNGGKRLYELTTAITGNVTTTSAPAGSIGVTSHATGKSSIFVSDGTKWQAHLAITPLAAGTHQAAVGALTSATLTDNSGGTANTTVEAIGGSFSQSEIANNFADVVAQINALRVDLAAVRTKLNATLTALEGNGVLAAS